MVMTADIDRPAGLRHRTARMITEVLAPAVWAAAMPLVVAVHSASTVGVGVAWGLVTLLFTSAIPFAVILIAVRRGKLTDHHIGRREQRAKPLLFGITSVIAGLVVLVVAGAAGELVAMVVVMLAVVAGTTLVNLVWKLSAHTAVASGSVAVLIVLFGSGFGTWELLLGALVVAAIGWSRVVLRDHTLAQVCAGAALGAPLAAAVFTLVR